MAKNSNLIISISIVLILLFLTVGSIFLIPKIQQALNQGTPFDYDFNYGRRTFEEGDKILTNFALLYKNEDRIVYSEGEPLGPPFVIQGIIYNYYNAPFKENLCCQTIESNYPNNCGPFLYLDSNLYNTAPLTIGEHNVLIKGYQSNGKYPQTCTRYDKEYKITVTASATTSTTTLPSMTTTSTSSTTSTTLPNNPCPTDTEICEDGSSVIRIPSRQCNFEDCPEKPFDWKLLLIPITIIVLLIAIISAIFIFRRRR